MSYREETGQKRAVACVWRISHGALPGLAYAHHIGFYLMILIKYSI